MMPFFRLIRIQNLLMMAVSLSLFYFFLLVPAHHFKLFTKLTPLSNLEFMLFVLSVTCIAAAGNIINDYFDTEADAAYKPNRPIGKGEISADTAIYLHAAFAFIGIGLGFYLGWRSNQVKIGYLYVITAVLLYVYSAYLKKIPLAGNLLVAGLTGFIFLLLMVFEAAFLNTIHFENAFYVMNVLLLKAFIYAGFAFLTNLTREIVKDLEDVEGDKAFNISTLPVAFGVTSGKIAAIAANSILLAATIAYIVQLYSVQGFYELTYLALAVVIPTLYVNLAIYKANQSKQFHTISLILKLIMVAGIATIPVFYWLGIVSGR